MLNNSHYKIIFDARIICSVFLGLAIILKKLSLTYFSRDITIVTHKYNLYTHRKHGMEAVNISRKNTENKEEQNSVSTEDLGELSRS